MSDELKKLKANIKAMQEVTEITRLVAEEEHPKIVAEDQSDEAQSNPPDQQTPNKLSDVGASEQSK